MKKKLLLTMSVICMSMTYLATTSVWAATSVEGATEEEFTEEGLEDILYQNTVFIDDISKDHLLDCQNITISEETVDNSTEIFDSKYDNFIIDDLEDETVTETRGTSKPTKFFDLTEGYYTASFDKFGGVTSAYTNYYFQPNSDGKIRINVSSIECDNKNVKIELYKVNDGKRTTWEGDPTNKLVTFSNMDTESMYYFKFKSDLFDSLKGYALIYHP